MMRRWLPIALLALFGGAASAQEQTLKVMTYNVRYASMASKEAWPARRPLIQQIIQKNAPDVIGTQEGLYLQLKDIEADLPDYRWIGLGREGGSHGEFMAIYFRHDRFQPIAFDHFWLSDTPNVIGSATWGNSVRRMVSWVKFHDKQANRRFILINTHFDHQVEASRQKSADLMRERALAMGDEEPIILTGDFNAAAGTSEAYKRLVGEDRFRDTWDVAKKLSPRTRTFNGFVHPVPEEGPRIDWILYRGPLTPIDILVDDSSFDGRYPSDHFPVIATLRYGP